MRNLKIINSFEYAVIFSIIVVSFKDNEVLNVKENTKENETLIKQKHHTK